MTIDPPLDPGEGKPLDEPSDLIVDRRQLDVSVTDYGDHISLCVDGPGELKLTRESARIFASRLLKITTEMTDDEQVLLVDPVTGTWELPVNRSGAATLGWMLVDILHEADDGTLC